MRSRTCTHGPRTTPGLVIAMMAATNKGVTCKKHSLPAHKGGCVSPDPQEYFHADGAPNTVTDSKDNSKPVNDDAECDCGKHAQPSA